MMDAQQVICRLRSIGAEGILTPEDLPGLDTQRRKVLELMSDGRWYSAEEIRQAAGGSEGLRRMRELRTIQGLGIRKGRSPHSKLWFYRLAWYLEENQ